MSGLYFGSFGMGEYGMENETWYDRVIKVLEEEARTNPEKFNPEKMKPSEECVAITEHFEGFSPVAYLDPVGILTLGHGFIHGVKPGDTITYEESKERLMKELDRDYAHAVRVHVKVPLTQGMFDALTCFTFNLGGGALANSTLLRKLNQKDYKGAAREFDRWVYAGGKKLNGLVRRRKAERAMFEGNDWREYA